MNEEGKVFDLIDGLLLAENVLDGLHVGVGGVIGHGLK
jgi:hypothetical protein